MRRSQPPKKLRALTKSNSTNREAIVERKRQRTELINRFKLGGCVICGYNSSMVALDFHHLDPKTKELDIWQKSYKYERIKKEITKCIVVCANCHREIHAGLINLESHGYETPIIQDVIPQPSLFEYH